MLPLRARVDPCVMALKDYFKLPNLPPEQDLTVRCKVKVNLVTTVEGDQKAPFAIATTPRCRGGATPFPGLLYFTLDTYLILLSVKQGGIKYHF